MCPSLCVFANFFIDNHERFRRMKDSFYSFRNINPDQWIINIRGRLKSQAGKFLKKELGDKIKVFNLQSRQGWFYDTKIILSHINADYVFIWVEDHILINNLVNLKNSILEMKKFKVDQLWYSFLTNQIKDRFAILPSHKKGKYITVTKIDEDACYKIRNKLKNDFYTIAMISIMRRDYFLKVIHSSKPYLKRWPRYLPFDFEKKSTDKVFPFILHALPNKELFASIDDDHGQDGYSLISRGIYKSSISREALKKMEFFNSKLNSKRLKKNIPKIFIPLVAKIIFFIRRINFTINIFKHK
jgi:hypothetical protein